MTEASEQEAGIRRIAEYVGKYAATVRQLTARFSDRNAIFPSGMISISGANVYSCRDAVVIDLTKEADPPRLQYRHLPETSGNEVVTELLLGVMVPEDDQDIPAETRGSPWVRFSNLGFETPYAKRHVLDIQVWTRPDAARLSPQLAEQLALEDVQFSLKRHSGTSVGRSVGFALVVR
jgi:hypothetical protein